MMKLSKRHLMFFALPLIVLMVVVFATSKTHAKLSGNLLTPQFVSANPQPVEIEQADGTLLTVVLKGDEFCHYAQTTDGYTILRGQDEVYRYAKHDHNGDLMISNVKASNPEVRGTRELQFLDSVAPDLRFSEKQVLESKYNRYKGDDLAQIEFAGVTGTFPTTGTRNFLVILVNFTDKAFVKTQANVNTLCNTATNSFKQFYLDSSRNQLTVNSTVVGPYNLSGNMATYGANDSYGNDVNPRLMVQQAIDAAYNAGVNFANYDNDGNGYVDGIMVMHAGYGEEAGAPANTIWSHRWTMSTYARTYNGVTINDYCTVPELANASGSTLTGVGVLCHEFGHNLGCPDYYDTDYSGSGGQAWDLTIWDVMASGSWNNGGNNPAMHGPYSKWKLGWLTPTTITATSNITLNNNEQNAAVYRYDTTTSGEYFLLENRQQIGTWDTYLSGHGMLVYHIDDNWIASHSSNNLNAFPTHQGVDLEEADNVRTAATYGADPFPGTGAKTSFTDTTTPNSLSWAGGNTNKPITNIAEASGVITFTITFGTPDYCSAASTNTTDEWIGSVKFGTVTKTSGASYYSNFTSTTFNMTRGASVSYTLTPAFSGSAYTEYWSVYIDYNKNKTFESTERVINVSGTAAKTGSFTVPTSALTGTTRIRVLMKYGSAASACGTFTYGEVEDYTANIL